MLGDLVSCFLGISLVNLVVFLVNVFEYFWKLVMLIFFMLF